MSDTHAQTVSYVRDTMLPEASPPATEIGAIRWLRENLFSSWLNAILTVLSIIFVYLVLMIIIPWLYNGIWGATSLSECRQILSVDGLGSHDGACFGVIADRWLQLLFGFYPSDLYWRPILAFVLFFVAIAPILFSEQIPRQMIWFSIVYPFLAVWLIWGGSIWGPLFILLGFVIAAVTSQLLTKLGGAIVGTLCAIVVAVVWWLFITPFLTDNLHRLVADARIESKTAELNETIEILTPRAEELEAQGNALNVRATEESATKDTLLEMALDLRAEQSPEFDAARTAFLNQMETVVATRREAAGLATEAFLTSNDLSTARTLLRNIRLLEIQETQLPNLITQARELRANLPEAVASLISTEGADGATREEKNALEATLEAEEQVASRQNRINSTYAALGRFGIEPVESDQIGGFLLAIIIGISAITLSLPFGIILALARQSDLPIIKYSAVVFIEVIRGVPLIVWLFTASLLLNYFLPPGTNFDLMLRVVIMVTLFASAYIAEVIRGGLAALPKGQYEAGDALGLDYWKSMQLIVLPQALKISIPGIVNTFIGLFKDTTLVSIISMFDPIGLSNAIRASTDWNGVYWELFLFIGVMFFIFCFSMGRYSLYLEKKLQREHR